MSQKPISEGAERPQRDARGRWLPGWKGGNGNPHLKKLTAHRKALLRAVKPEDIERVFRVLLAKAEGGDLEAAKVLFERTLGKPSPSAEFVNLRPINGPADILGAFADLLEQLNRKSLSVDAAARAASVIELNRKAYETADLAEQVREIREHINREDPKHGTKK